MSVSRSVLRLSLSRSISILDTSSRSHVPAAFTRRYFSAKRMSTKMLPATEVTVSMISITCCRNYAFRTSIINTRISTQPHDAQSKGDRQDVHFHRCRSRPAATEKGVKAKLRGSHGTYFRSHCRGCKRGEIGVRADELWEKSAVEKGRAARRARACQDSAGRGHL